MSAARSDSEDEADIRLAQEGDIRAFERLIAAHVEKVRRFARAFARDQADADDLAQEALIKVYRSIGSYRLEAAFSTWLYAIVRNTYLDVQKSRAQRDRAREASLPRGTAEIEGSETAPSPDDQMSQVEERQRLWQAIAAIGAEFRTALVLFDIEGLSYEEVAAVENVPLGTIKSRLKRGRDQLRRALEKTEQKAGNRRNMELVSTEEGME